MPSGFSSVTSGMSNDYRKQSGLLTRYRLYKCVPCVEYRTPPGHNHEATGDLKSENITYRRPLSRYQLLFPQRPLFCKPASDTLLSLANRVAPRRSE